MDSHNLHVKMAAINCVERLCVMLGEDRIKSKMSQDKIRLMLRFHLS